MSAYRYELQSFIDELDINLEESEELFSSYLSEMNKLISDMELNIEENKLESLGKTLHSIKGLSANFYIVDVYEETMAFEILLKENGNVDVSIYKDSLITLIKEAEKEVSRFFQDNK